MKKVIGFLGLFIFGAAVAAVHIPTPSSSYIPRVYARGDAGSNEIGQGDVLAPIFQQNNINVFAYGQGRYAYARQSWGKNPWAASFGFGYRQLVANSVILGAFVLGDYMKTITDHKLKQFSPGIELLSRTWDFRANGYFPLGKKKWTLEGWADQFGDYRYISFSGHNQYDAWYIFTEEAGPGADAELGRTLFDFHHVLVKGYVNSYFFKMNHHNDVKGLGARVTIQPNTYLELSLNDSYDKYSKNIFTAGLRLSFYDLFNGASTVLDNNNLHWRLFTPIERNFGELGFGDDTRVTGGPEDGGSPEPEPVPPPGPTWYGHVTPEKTNVWFFETGGLTATANGVIGGDGTYEHPYINTQFTQGTIDNINTTAPGALLYFTSGIYSAYNGTNPIVLNNGQSMWGRMGANKGYQMPATGSNRPLFIGALNLESNTEVDSIRLENGAAPDPSFTTGITLNGATNVVLNNDEIGSDSDMAKSYATDISMDNSSLTVKNSTISSYRIGQGLPSPFVPAVATGIEMNNGGTLVVDNTHINADAVGAGVSNDGLAYGIHADGSGQTITVENGSKINVSAGVNAPGFGGGNVEYAGNAYGILLGSNYNNGVTTLFGNNVTVNNSEIQVVGNPGDWVPSLGTAVYYSGNAYGILIGDTFGKEFYDIENNTISVSNSTITATAGSTVAHAQSSSNGYGILVGMNESHTDSDKTSSLQNNIIAFNNSATTINAKAGNNTTDFSGNGFGLIIGNNYGFSVGSTSILDNKITVDESSSITTKGKGGRAYAGNAFGVVIGNNRGAYYGGSPRFFKLNNNTIEIKAGSTIDAESLGDAATNEGSSNNGFGVLIGNNSAAYYESSAGIRQIFGNNITVDGATISAIGKGTSGSDYSGNGYGILIGNNSAVSVNKLDIGEAGSGNTITVENSSSVTASGQSGAGTNSGFVYGLLIGNGYVDVPAGVTIDINKIDVKDSAITTYITGSVGKSYGLALLGANNSLHNILKESNSIITINANSLEAYGMYAGATALDELSFTPGDIIGISTISSPGGGYKVDAGGTSQAW